MSKEEQGITEKTLEQWIEYQINALAESLAMRDLRKETNGQCDIIDPDSVIGQEYARLAFTLKTAWIEMLTNEINKV